MNRKYSLLLVLITAIFELAFLVWTRADYRSTLLDGEEYEVPAAIEFQGDFYDRNYIAVNVPITETKWEGEREPETGETIYLVIRKGQKGALILDHAQPAQPSGSYIKTRALRIMDGTHRIFQFSGGPHVHGAGAAEETVRRGTFRTGTGA